MSFSSRPASRSAFTSASIAVESWLSASAALFPRVVTPIVTTTTSGTTITEPSPEAVRVAILAVSSASAGRARSARRPRAGAMRRMEGSPTPGSKPGAGLFPSHCGGPAAGAASGNPDRGEDVMHRRQQPQRIGAVVDDDGAERAEEEPGSEHDPEPYARRVTVF